jgi:membrane protease YdiL (CAAX protease family)
MNRSALARSGSAEQTVISSGIGLLLTIGLISLPFGRWLGQFQSVGHMVLTESAFWAIVVIALLYVCLIEQRPLSSIGIRKPGVVDLALAVATGALIVALMAAVYLVIFPALHWNEGGQLKSISAIPRWLQCIVVVRAAVSEEITFRGYGIERVQELTGSRAIAGLATLSVFTIDHISFWGWHHLLVAGSAGAVLTLFYLWRRNLWASMLAHFIVDAVGFLAA